MFILKKKGTNQYVRNFSRYPDIMQYTTNINQANPYHNLHDVPGVYISAYAIKCFHLDFDVIEVEFKIKKAFDNLRKI